MIDRTSPDNDDRTGKQIATVSPTVLLSRYREVLFSSLVTSFGLDFVLFRNDEQGGHVDTNHGVSERAAEVERDRRNGKEVSKQDAAKRIFKKGEHQASYAGCGDYDPDPYHKDKRYIDKNRRDKQAKEAGTLRDSYTGKQFGPNDKTELDHTVSAKEHHNDPRRFLSQLDPVATANHESNLHSTDPAVNGSKGAKAAKRYIEALKAGKAARQQEIDKLLAAEERDSLSDADRKRLRSLTARNNVDQDELNEVDQQSRKTTTRSHDLAYYSSRDFLGTTTLNAVWAGGKMAARQCIGMVLLELSMAVQAEMPKIMIRWRAEPSWRSRLNFKHLLGHVQAVVLRTWESVRGRLGDFWQTAKDGIVAGVMSEIVTTVINIFATTIKRIMRLVRNLWSGIIGALRIIVLNPDNLGLEDRLAAVMRLISVAVGGAVQPIVSEALDKLMVSVPLPHWLREPLTDFAGAAVGGVLSASLLYAIEKSPVVQIVADSLRSAGQLTEAIWRQVATLSELAWQCVRDGTEMLMRSCTSPAVDLLMFVACPPLGLAVQAVRATARLRSTLGHVNEQQAMIRREINDLSTSVQVGLNSMQGIMAENTALLRCVLSGQEAQFAIMGEVRADIREAVDRLRKEIEQAGRETADMVAVREAEKELTQLSDGYRACADVRSLGDMPPRRDLEAIEGLADSVLARLRLSLERQLPGSPGRLPLLRSMAFAIATWRDVRAALGEPVSTCLVRAAHLRDLVGGELRALTEAATLWQLAQERAWLIEQHVLLRRTLGSMIDGENVFGMDDFAVQVASDIAQVRMAWNDGLQPIRDLLAESSAQPPLGTLPLPRYEDAKAWAKMAGLPMGVAVTEVPMEQLRYHMGIPDTLPLGEASLQLVHAAVELANDNRSAIAREIA